MALPLGPGAPQACQGDHRTSKGHQILVRATTGLPRSTTGLAGAPVRGTTGLSGAPQACQGHHDRPVKDITVLSGTPQSLPGAPVHSRAVHFALWLTFTWFSELIPCYGMWEILWHNFIRLKSLFRFALRVFENINKTLIFGQIGVDANSHSAFGSWLS